MKFLKQIFCAAALFLSTFALHAQHAPAGINYQAVLRDQQGQIIADQPVKVRVAVNDPESRTTFYTEVHRVTTNNVGIFTLIIGEGQPEKSAFKDIPWSSANTWLEIAYDTDNNGTYEITGTTRMLSVPYAFYAEQAGSTVNSNGINAAGADGGGMSEEAWMLKGNLEVNDAWMFLGTRNYADLVVKTNNVERMRITKGMGSDGHDALIHLQEDVTADKSVTIGGALTVGGQTLLNDQLMVVGNTSLKSGLRVGGDTYLVGFTRIGGNLNVDGTSVFNQDITVMGDGSFGGDIKVDHDLFVHNDVLVDRNFELGNDLHVGNDVDIDHNLNVDNDAHFGQDIDVDRNVNIDNFLNVEGGAEIGLDLLVERNAVIGNDFYVQHNAFLQNNLEVTKDATIGQDLEVVRNASVGQDLTVDRNLEVDDAAHVGTDLDVDRNANIDNDLEVGRNAMVGSNLEVGQNLTVGGTLEVAGLSKFSSMEIENHLKVKGDAELQQDVSVGGGLNVAGAGEFGGFLNVDGAAFVNGTLNAACGLNVKSCVSGPDYDIFSYPILVHGGNQGIAIQVEESRSSANNYVSFFDTEGMQGRIEGQTAEELHNSFEYVWYQIMEASGVGLTAAEAVACGIQVDVAEVVVNTVDAILSLADWIQYDVNLDLKLGVVYESGSGDYAEWLEREDPKDVMQYGEIVGVIGGKISRNTPANSKVMVISYSPIVLGNMPAANREKDFEKVAFMGQVPVRVAGAVEIGDYILPSGHNDGIGIAVHPKDMSTQDYARIVGVAWEASNGSLINVVNVAVGINTNDIALRVAEQEQSIHQVKQEINHLYALLGEKSPYGNLATTATANGPAVKNEPVAAASIAQSNTFTKAEANQKIEAARPMLEQIMNKTRERFENQGINYQQYPEVVSILSNPVGYLQSMNDRGYLTEEFLKGEVKH